MFELETWKNIEGYEGIYQVSNLGKVKSLSRFDGNHHFRAEKVLKPFDIGNGYFRVNLFKNGKVKHAYIHRLVAKAFVSNVEGKSIVNHLNEDPSDNKATNLAWATTKENVNYGTAVNRRSQKCKKPIIRIDVGSGEEFFYDSFCSAEKDGFNRSAIYNCCSKRAKTHKGYKWEYSN